MKYGGNDGSQYGGSGAGGVSNPLPSGYTYPSPTFTGTVTANGSGNGFASGTVTDPSIGWQADADGAGTGFYRRTTNTVSVASNGAAIAEFSVFGIQAASTAAIGFNSGALNGALDAALGRAATNSIVFAGGTPSAGAATSRTEINKTVTAISNNVATAVFTVTVPNAQHNATIEVELTGILGAGGAIGAGEASSTNSYKINVSRTAGVNAVASAVSTAFGAAASNVAGAATVTTTGAVSAISGAVGATNTFTINVTIVRSGGSSDNHVCLAYAKVMNANATGITIS